MASNKDMSDGVSSSERTPVAVREVGNNGRITIPAELRGDFGSRFLFVRTPSGIVLEPVGGNTGGDTRGEQ